MADCGAFGMGAAAWCPARNTVSATSHAYLL